MATRKYQQRLRLERAEDTRRRILDAVYRHLRDSPTEPVSLDAVARDAGVARSTIYLVFASRAGLFDALVDDLWQRTGLSELTTTVAHADAREHLRGGIRAANAMYAADRDVYRVLFSMAPLEPTSFGDAITRKERNRSGGMTHLARRLAEQNLLRPGITVEHAVNVLWVLCSFESFDLLYTGRGLTLAATTELTISIAERALLVDGAGTV
jgi:AcrR family transcriptional regulator